MPRPSATRSNGNARLHIAVMRNTAAETKRGKDGEMERRIPAVIGAVTPVLGMSSVHRLLQTLTADSGRPMFRTLSHGYSSQTSLASYRLTLARPGRKHPYSHKTAYIAVADAEMIMELTTTAQSSETLMNAKVDNAVAVVHIAKDFRRPSRVCIIHAPTIEPGHPATERVSNGVPA